MAITTFADRYQSILVPLIFEPWAQELIRRAAPEPGEHILYLACGTGVVTRQVANHVAHPGCLVGVDHSGDMLAVFRDEILQGLRPPQPTFPLEMASSTSRSVNRPCSFFRLGDLCSHFPMCLSRR